MTVNIAIIDQNEIYRESLKTVLEQIKGFRVVLVSGDCNCLKNSFNVPVQAILLDNSLGKEKCKELVRDAEANWESIRTLILGMYREELDLNFGSAETILKSSGKKEFETKIRKLTSCEDHKLK